MVSIVFKWLFFVKHSSNSSAFKAHTKFALLRENNTDYSMKSQQKN